ncbi:MAG TPA: phytoene desaturase family protein [Patescibacteria group bacterium]|nr:phytoene desaturase family protein [Patescibacteria group bacterium]
MNAIKKRGSVIVIGAGIGGMATAARLAYSGWDVTLFEKNDISGGKMNRIEFDGCVFDTGPSLITMPFVFKEFFASCGRNFDDYVTLRSLEPTCRYFWRDGTRFDAFKNGQSLIKELCRVFPDEIPAVEKYLRDAKKAYEGTKDIFLFNPFDGFKEFLKPRNISLLPFLSTLRPHKTLHALHKSFFKSTKLIQLFDRFATYNGSTPYRAPATLSIISHVELGLGAFYPEGGIYAIARAFEKLCRELGVNIYFKRGVASIICENAVAKGVQLESGEIFKSDIVVSNADVYWTRRYLLKEDCVRTRELSLSGFVALVVVKKKNRGLSHHNILFADDYRAEFDELFKKKNPPDDMTVYISNSSYSDPSMAVSDRENWFILVNAPANGSGKFWEVLKEEYFQKILKKIQSYGLDIREDILNYKLITPDDLQSRYSAWGGSIYGSASNNIFSAFLRPKNVSDTVKNLFYVGGSTHPGGGVPLVVLSGKIVSEIINEGY